MKYSEKLRDPRWQRKRLEILQRDNWACQRCFDDESTLNVHHRRYIPGGNPWDSPNEDLVTLCEECHSYEQEMWAEAMGVLEECLQFRGFFSRDVMELGFAVRGFPDCPQGVLPTILTFLARNQDEFQRLYELYFQSIAAVTK